MTDMDTFISETISEGMAAIESQKSTESQNTEQPAETPEIQPEAEHLAETPEAEAPQETGEGGEDQPFPKKAVNALSRKDKKITKLQARLNEVTARERELNETVHRLKSEMAGATPPQEGDFETYGDYLDAIAEFKVEQSFRNREVKNAEKSIEETRREGAATFGEITNEHATAINDSEVSAKQKFPDYEAVLERGATQRLPNGQAKIPLSDLAQQALAESGEAASALYLMIKGGALDELNSLTSPYQAAYMIQEHLNQGGAPVITQQTKSLAPKPIKGLTGAGVHTKPMADMSYEELKKEFRL